MKKYLYLINHGYTLVEIIVILGIIAIVSGFGIATYNSYNEQLILRNQAKKIANIIELAKKKAVAGDLSQQALCETFQGYIVEINDASFGKNVVLDIKCSGSRNRINTYPLDNNITSTDGFMNFFPLGSVFLGNDDPTYVLPIKLRNSKIGQCITVSVTSIGIVTTDDNLSSCP